MSINQAHSSPLAAEPSRSEAAEPSRSEAEPCQSEAVASYRLEAEPCQSEAVAEPYRSAAEVAEPWLLMLAAHQLLCHTVGIQPVCPTACPLPQTCIHNLCILLALSAPILSLCFIRDIVDISITPIPQKDMKSPHFRLFYDLVEIFPALALDTNSHHFHTLVKSQCRLEYSWRYNIRFEYFRA